MTDERIIELFFEKSEQAINELDQKYGKICRSVAYGVLGNQQDAEECVNDAYLGVWNAIPPANPSHLLAFACKIVKNISLKRHEKNTAVKRNSIHDVSISELEECLASSSTVEEKIEEQELTKIIEEFLNSLSKENRVIFLRRYWFLDTYADISERVGITEKNVSVRLSRIRKELRKYLIKRGVLL